MPTLCRVEINTFRKSIFEILKHAALLLYLWNAGKFPILKWSILKWNEKIKFYLKTVVYQNFREYVTTT